jgi:nicotinamide riboside transporter PnuC
MSFTEIPWSFYATLASFAILFASLNLYILTLWLAHPMASPLWLVGVVIGVLCLVYSVRMVRVHQAELVEKKRQEISTESIDD